VAERGRGGARNLKQRVKTARGRKTSSTRWLHRQLNDPYVARARAEGMRSRAAYKLIELNDKYRLLRAGMRIVDLGAAPGGWSEVAARILGADDTDPRIVAVDCVDMDPIPGVRFVRLDFTDPAAADTLVTMLGGHKADVVLSDLAAPTTGHRQTDHLRIVALVELAADFATQVLAPGGAFVAKVLQGGTEHELLGALKRRFDSISHAKPPASRSDSAETYLVARGFRG
jgi:23S rRNA (uridine2552-2'-O)-methyltransferase